MRLSTATALALRLALGSAFLSMTSAGDFSPVAVVGFLAILVASTALPRPAPTRLAAGLLVVTGAVMLVLVGLFFFGSMDPVLGASILAAVVSLNRLLSRQRAADDGMIYLTSLLMVAAGAALSGELQFGVCFAVYAIVTTVGLTLSHLERAADDRQASAGERQALLSARLVGALTSLSGVSLAGAITFFVLFPRVNARWWGRHGSLGSGRNALIGFSDTVRLGGYGVGRDDPRPALRITLDDAQDKTTLDYLWRGHALDTFDGISWKVGPQELAPKPPIPLPRHGAFHAVVEVLPVTAARVIFSVGPAGRVHVTNLDNQAETAVPHHIYWNEQGDGFVVPQPQGYYAYEVWSLPPEMPVRAGPGEIPARIKELDLQLPEQVDPRIHELAEAWTKGLRDPVAIAEAIQHHLQRDYGYTTELRGDLADPVADFLFTHKAGHCEYFSTSMALMLRTMGIPAREVTGFTGGIRPPGANYFIVRAGDAHSWTEAYIPGSGFVPFDPTPESFRDAAPRGLWASVTALVDELSSRWRVAVLEYDLREQGRLLSSAVQAISSATARFRRPQSRFNEPWLAAVALVAAGMGVVWTLRSARRPPQARARQEVTRLYLQALRTLERRGHRRDPAETPLEFARRLRAAAIPQAGELEDLTAAYNACRFGDGSLGPAERARMRDHLARL